jgi:hypothetical protein
MSVAARRKIVPTTRSKRKTAEAIAKARVKPTTRVAERADLDTDGESVITGV